MKLYSIDNSPYAARVRMAIRHRQLPVEICPPPEPLRSAEFMKSYPLGKVPLLELDSGATIAESTVILDYLEDVYPEGSMRADTALGRARDGMLGRWADTHLPGALFPLFGMMFRGEPAEAERVGELVEPLDREMAKLARLLAEDPDSAGRALLLGDLCAASSVAYVSEALSYLALEALPERYPDCATWWSWVNGFEAVRATLEEMLSAHHAIVGARG